MDGVTLFCLVLAFFWGWLWAWCLQDTRIGRFLALKRTWITVVIGVGVDLAIAGIVLPAREWLLVVGIVALSSVGIIRRSLWNELGEIDEVMGVFKDPAGE